MKLGLTGTNRSCNRASCGACSVLVDGVPFYSCHTLATEGVGRKILTIEGVGDENESASAAAYRPYACGRRLRLLHRRMDGDGERAARQESQSERGPGEGSSGGPHLPLLGIPEHHPGGGGFGGGFEREQDTNRTRAGFRRSAQDADGAGLLDDRRTPAGQRSGGGREQDRHEEVAGISAGKSQRTGQAADRSCRRFPFRGSPARRSTPAACGSRICCT